MKILALAVLLIAITLTQHHADNKTLGKQSQHDTQSAKDKSVAPTPSQPSANPSDQKPSGDADKNKKQAVDVYVPEKISVKPDEDWVMVICTIILTGVGIVGTCAAVKTLKAIRVQAHYMRVHAQHFDKLAKATANQLAEMEKAREIQTKTLILQYRPKIIVRNAKALQFGFELGKPGNAKIRFTVVNAGGSPAHIIEGSSVRLMSCTANSVEKINFKEGGIFNIPPSTLQPGQQTVFDATIGTGTTHDIDWANFHEGLKVAPSRFIIFAGAIRYLDDLTIPRATGVSRIYDPKTRNFDPKKDTESEYTD